MIVGTGDQKSYQLAFGQMDDDASKTIEYNHFCSNQISSWIIPSGNVDLFFRFCRFSELAGKYGFTKDGESIQSFTTVSSKAIMGPEGTDQVVFRHEETGRKERLRIREDEEKIQVIEEMHLGLTFGDLKKIFKTLDINKDGSITHAEFIRGLKKHKTIARKLGISICFPDLSLNCAICIG